MQQTHFERKAIVPGAKAPLNHSGFYQLHLGDLLPNRSVRKDDAYSTFFGRFFSSTLLPYGRW